MDEITTTTASVDEYDEELDLSIQKQIDALTLEEEEEDEEDEEELEELEDDDEDDDEDDEKLAKDNNQTNAQAIVACAYCGISNPSCVVKCKKTQKWFCNSKTGALPASCIVFHLVKSRSNAIVLHPESPLGELEPACYVTDSTNVFNLGFIVKKDEDPPTVALLSRDVVLQPTAQLKALDLDLTKWEPVVTEDKTILSWLVNEPGEQETLRARQVTQAQATALEDLWKSDPKATIDDVEKRDADAEPQPVALRYADAYQYQNVFGPLIAIEADYDKSQKESQHMGNVSVRWDVGLNARRVMYFGFSSDEEHLKIILGDELVVKLNKLDGTEVWRGDGTVIRYNVKEEEIGLELDARSSIDCPVNVTSGYEIECVWKSISYDRCQAALKAFAVDDTSVSGYIYHKLLGHDVNETRLNIDMSGIKKWSAPNLPELNQSQIAAVKMVLQQPLSLIQGPPGTGKTVTSASIVYHLATKGDGQVIVAAPSNVAVDQLAEKIEKTGLKVVRIVARSREHVNSSVEHLALHYQVQRIAEKEKNGTLAKLQRLKDSIGELSKDDERRYRKAMRKIENDIIQNADVVCVTAVGAGDVRLASYRFRQVLFDESTQATEPETLIPIIMGAKQVVMVGDHCQLGPVVTCRRAARAGLSQSLFERLIFMGVQPIRLQIQYRMHPCLSEFPSNAFYEGTLQNGVNERDRSDSEDVFPWPSKSKPMMFWAQMGVEEMSASGTSYLNRGEAMAVEKIVTHLLQNSIRPEEIGVVTPYEGQRAYVVNHMTRTGVLHPSLYQEVEVASVDAFQGREKQYIIVTCVRSNDRQGIGFLNDPRRLNVALTRAKLGLMIVGNPKVLAKQPLFREMLQHFRDNGCLVEGNNINALVECMVALPQPRWKSRAAGLSRFVAKETIHEDSEYNNNNNTNNNDGEVNLGGGDFFGKKIPPAPRMGHEALDFAHHHINRDDDVNSIISDGGITGSVFGESLYGDSKSEVGSEYGDSRAYRYD
jgi:regulator of nonsense transcripts 1